MRSRSTEPSKSSALSRAGSLSESNTKTVLTGEAPPATLVVVAPWLGVLERGVGTCLAACGAAGDAGLLVQLPQPTTDGHCQAVFEVVTLKLLPVLDVVLAPPTACACCLLQDGDALLPLVGALPERGGHTRLVAAQYALLKVLDVAVETSLDAVPPGDLVALVRLELDEARNALGALVQVEVGDTVVVPVGEVARPLVVTAVPNNSISARRARPPELTGTVRRAAGAPRVRAPAITAVVTIGPVITGGAGARDCSGAPGRTTRTRGAASHATCCSCASDIGMTPSASLTNTSASASGSGIVMCQCAFVGCTPRGACGFPALDTACCCGDTHARCGTRGFNLRGGGGGALLGGGELRRELDVGRVCCGESSGIARACLARCASCAVSARSAFGAASSRLATSVTTALTEGEQEALQSVEPLRAGAMHLLDDAGLPGEFTDGVLVELRQELVFFVTFWFGLDIGFLGGLVRHVCITELGWSAASSARTNP